MTRGKLLGLLVALAVAAGGAWWLLQPAAPPAPAPRPAPPLQPPASAAEAISRLRREIEELRQGGKSRVEYRAPTNDERDAYRGWLDARLRLATGSTADVAPPAGFRLLDLGGIGQLLAEEQHQKRGAGVVALRSGPAQPWVIEVPHSFFDEGTLEVGLNAFVLTNARALLVNTVHRYRSRAGAGAEGSDGGDDEDESVSSDVAHAETSFFLTAHAACVDLLGEVGVVQLHGFADGSAPAADLVLSPAGSRADAVPPARALERALGIRVAVYPAQIRKLGGTKNVQARYSIAAGRPFLHVEMSRSLRRQLTSDPERLRGFIGALFGGAL